MHIINAQAPESTSAQLVAPQPTQVQHDAHVLDIAQNIHRWLHIMILEERASMHMV